MEIIKKTKVLNATFIVANGKLLYLCLIFHRKIKNVWTTSNPDVNYYFLASSM